MNDNSFDKSRLVEKVNFQAYQEDFDSLMSQLRDQKQRQSMDNSVETLRRNENSFSLPRLSIAKLDKQPSQTIIRSVRFLLDNNTKSEKLTFKLRAPWRETSKNTKEPFNKVPLLLPSGDIDAHSIYVNSNLILQRSLKDNKIQDGKPFKLNTRYNPKEFEVPPDSLIKKKARLKLLRMRDEHEDFEKKKKEDHDNSVVHRRQLNAIKTLTECQTAREQKDILEKTLQAEMKYKDAEYLESQVSLLSRVNNNHLISQKYLSRMDQSYYSKRKSPDRY